MREAEKVEEEEEEKWQVEEKMEVEEVRMREKGLVRAILYLGWKTESALVKE